MGTGVKKLNNQMILRRSIHTIFTFRRYPYLRKLHQWVIGVRQKGNTFDLWFLTVGNFVLCHLYW